MCDDISTGDILLFGNNTFTGFLLKIFTLSDWSHVGVAIRLDNGGKVTKKGGKLGVMEMNTGKRLDLLSNEIKDGFGITDINFSFKEQDITVVRKLRDNAISEEDLVERTTNFLNQTSTVKFPDGTLPYVEVWMGYQVDDINNQRMICSEMISHYYLNLFPDKKLEGIFGRGVAAIPKLMAPYHFDSQISRHSRYFEDKMITAHVSKMDTRILIQPIIIALFFGAIFYTLIEDDTTDDDTNKN